MSQAPIKDFETWKKSLRNFEWLNDVVPGASDIDGVVHASARGEDHFLFFEGKQVGQPVPLGQQILLDALQKLPNTQVVVVYGPDDLGLYVLSGSWHGKVDLDALRSMVKTWWKNAKHS